MQQQMLIQDARQQYALLVDPSTGREFNISRYTTSIGRSISCDIVLTDKSVSRQHAVVYFLAGRFYVEDVGSTNGTILNGKMINGRVPLMAGDELELGVSRLTFQLIPNRQADQVFFVDGEPTVVN